MTQFQPGDRMTHDPTGEEWTLIRAYGSYVVLSALPELRALTSDCTLICGCTTTDQRDACTKQCDAVVL
jgi:hypothetical protein